MYKSLLPELKPLVFEGKSGILQVTHKYNDQARLFLKEGIIDQVETTKMSGKKAASTCARWISITTRFQEGEKGDYTPDPEIDTNSILSFLEKTYKNIEIINKNIPDDSAIFQIDSNKLNTADKLGAEDLKIALLFNGKRNIEQTVSMSGKSELAVLTHTCRLILSGVAKKVALKNVMAKQDQEDFLQSLNETLTDLVGPAGSILVNDAFEKIDSQPDMLAREEIPLLLAAIGTFLDDEEKGELDAWGTTYL